TGGGQQPVDRSLGDIVAHHLPRTAVESLLGEAIGTRHVAVVGDVQGDEVDARRDRLWPRRDGVRTKLGATVVFEVNGLREEAKALAEIIDPYRAHRRPPSVRMAAACRQSLSGPDIGVSIGGV